MIGLPDQDFQLLRRQGVGGSDMAPLFGFTTWGTEWSLYREKKGLARPREQSEDQRWGHILEPVIRQEYANLTGRVVHMPTDVVVHPQHAFLRANPDGLMPEHRGIFESKASRFGDDFGTPGTDEVPIAYFLQVQHYMACTGYDWADIAVLVGGSDFRVYHVKAHAPTQRAIVWRAAEFWHRVLTDDEPEPTTPGDAREAWQAKAGGIRIANPQALRDIRQVRELKAHITALETERDTVKTRLMNFMGEAETLVAPGSDTTLATWKPNTKGTRVFLTKD